MLVALHHYQLARGAQNSAMYRLSPHAAVPFFFLLSSFLLSKPFVRGTPVRYWRFLSRRVLRLYPPYVAALALAILGDLRFHGLRHAGHYVEHTWDKPVTAPLVLKHLLLIGNYDYTQFNTALWSLRAELRLVILFPLLFAMLRNMPSGAVIIAAALVTAVRPMASDRMAGLAPYIPFLSYLPVFMVGIVLARHASRCIELYQRAGRGKSSAFLAISLALFCEGHLVKELPLRGLWRLDIWPETIGSACLMVTLLSSPRLEQAFARTRLGILGKASFSLYLIHGTVLFSLIGLGALELPLAASFSFYVVASALGAWAFYFLVDSRIVRLLAAMDLPQSAPAMPRQGLQPAPSAPILRVPENVWSAARLQGEVWSRRQVCANVFGLWVEIDLLARMRCARVGPYKSHGR